MQLHKSLDQRQLHARGYVTRIGLAVDAVKNVLHIFGRHAHAGVRHLQAETALRPLAVEGEGHADAAVFSRQAEGVGEQVVDHALQLFGVGHHHAVRVRRGLHVQVDVAAEGERPEGIGPPQQGRAQVKAAQIERQAAILVAAEVDELIDQPLQQGDVSVGHVQQVAVVGIQAGAVGQLTDGLGNEAQRRADVAEHVVVKVLTRPGGVGLLPGTGHHPVALLLGLPLLAEQLGERAAVAAHRAHHIDQQSHDQHQHPDADQQERALRGHAHQEGVELAVELLYFLVEGGNVVGLQLHDTGVLPVDHSRGQERFARIVAALEDVHGHLHHPVASGGVDKGGIQSAGGHHLHPQPLARKGINANELHRRVAPHAGRGLTGSGGHGVVVGKHEVNARLAPENGVKSLRGRLAEPAGVGRGHDVDVGVSLQRVEQTAVSVACRSGALQARQFHHVAPAAQAVGNVSAHLAPHAVVVGPDVGRVLLGIDFPVHQHHGNALPVSLFNDRSHGVGLVGRHHNQVDSLADKSLDVGNLAAAVVVGRAELHPRLRIEKSLAADFLVHLRAPGVVAALRHANDIARPLRPTATQKEQTQDGTREKEAETTLHGHKISVQIYGFNP